MKAGTKSFIAEEGGKILSTVLRVAMTRPHKSSVPDATIEEPDVLPIGTGRMIEIPLDTGGKAITPEITQNDLDYRWECCMKHLGGANVLLREAYERAIDEGMGEGTAEKVLEAMNEHSAMEVDLEKMLPVHEAREQAEKLMSGVRAFRKAAWEAKLITGGGTKDDVADARLWNDLLYQEAFSSAKQQPGESCIQEGM